MTREQREAGIRRRAFKRLDKAIAEAKRLADAAHSLQTTDPLVKLRKTLRDRYGPATQQSMAADDSDESDDLLR